MRRSIAIAAAWGLGWIVYMIAMVVTVYDGILSLIFQPIMGALVATVTVGISLLAGLIFRVAPIGRAWRAVWFLAPLLAIGSIVLMCLGARWGLTETSTDAETGRQVVGLRSDVAIASYVVMVFAIINWPQKRKV